MRKLWSDLGSWEGKAQGCGGYKKELGEKEVKEIQEAHTPAEVNNFLNSDRYCICIVMMSCPL